MTELDLTTELLNRPDPTRDEIAASLVQWAHDHGFGARVLEDGSVLVYLKTRHVVILVEED